MLVPHADIIALTNMWPCVSYYQPMEPNGNVPPEARLLVLSYAHPPSARAGTTGVLVCSDTRTDTPSDALMARMHMHMLTQRRIATTCTQ